MTFALQPGVAQTQLWWPPASVAGQVQNTHDLVMLPICSTWPLAHSAGIQAGHQLGRPIPTTVPRRYDMKIAKFLVAAATAALVAVGAAITDDVITSAEWVAIALAGLGAAGVYFVPNKPDAS